MRKSTKICIFLLLFCFSFISRIHSQAFLDSVYQFTSGSNDHNPRFPVYTEGTFSYTYEYFVFERRLNPSSSKIFIRKIDGDGPVGNEIEISENNFKNINPVIAYNNFSIGNEISPEYILVAWQTNKNGSNDIYGKYFLNGTWSNEFPIDSSAQNSVSPEIVCRDSSNFFIVYEREGEIIYKEFNILNAALSSEINITSDDTTLCRNPFIATFGPSDNKDSLIIVSYERDVSLTNVPIVCKINSNGNWSSSYIITGSGVNVNNGFLGNQSVFFTIGIYSTYEKRDSLNTDIYINLVSFKGGTDSLLINPVNSADNFNSLAGGRSYFVQDGNTFTVFGFIEDNLFDKKALFYLNSPISPNPDLIIQATPEFSFDTLEVSLTVNHALPKELPNAGCRIYWFLFNKSETGEYQSRIHGIQFRNCYYVNISPISSEIPNTFALKQNYPNPFNPSTKIRFDIPLNEKQVKLVVFNSIGQEVATLINEQLQPGEYEYTFDASGYPSGVFFYKLQAGSFSETKRMVLVK